MRPSLFVLLALVAPPLHAQAGAVGLLPLAGDGVDAEVVDRVDSKVRDEMRRLPNVKLARLPEQGPAMCAGDDVPCLVRLGEAAGVAKLAVGMLSPRDDGYLLELRVIDVLRGAPARETTEVLAADATTHPARVREAATRLFAPELYVGRLLLSVSKPGARVLVDGALVGSSPLEHPVKGLVPGRHALEVRLPGHKVVSRFVEVAFGEVTTERVVLVEGEGFTSGSAAEPAPPGDEPGGASLATVLYGAGGGLAAAGAATLLAAGLVAGLAYGLPTGAGPGASDDDARARHDGLAPAGMAAGGLAIAGGVAVASGLVLLLAALLE